MNYVQSLTGSTCAYVEPTQRVVSRRPKKSHRAVRRTISMIALVAAVAGFTFTVSTSNASLPKEQDFTGANIRQGRTSWFGQYGYGKFNNKLHTHVWVDKGDNGLNASGLPQTVPGIALYTRKTLGHWFEVKLNGRIFVVRQVDVGPAPWTKRVIDINAPLADMAGYSPRNFPTDSVVKFRYLGPSLPVGYVASVPGPKVAILTPSEFEQELQKEQDKQGEKKIARSRVQGPIPYGLHPAIRDSMVKASAYLPDGYKLEFNNAHRPGKGQGPHGMWDSKGALAVDIFLIDPEGKRMKNIRAPQNFAAYERFMQWTKKIMVRDYPELKGKGRWGGYFATGTPGDLMHFDLMPEDRTMAGNWKEGLKPQFAHFGTRDDVGNGMGDILAFRLPEKGPSIASR